jgi:chemoreceptor zinc-binding protein
MLILKGVIIMADQAEIDKAIAAHGMWKTRLKDAIEKRKIDTPAETIRVDNQCAFGKWLYSPALNSVDKASEHYKTVKDLHAEFHKTAAKVVELALDGKRIEAEKMIALDGDYAGVSSKLTSAMMGWKRSLR